MSPAYGPFASLEHYLQVRARDHGHTLSSLAEELNYGRSYLNSIATEQFRPSVKRCRELARYFGDDPDIVLTLAGFREAPPTDNVTIDALDRIAHSLSPHLQKTVLDFADFLKTREATRAAGMLHSEIYVELPSGDTFTVDLGPDQDLRRVPASDLRIAIRAAIGAALARAPERETIDK